MVLAKLRFIGSWFKRLLKRTRKKESDLYKHVVEF